MGRMDYLAMKTDEDTNRLINEDLNELKLAAKKLLDHATKLGGLGFGTSLLKWFASFAAMESWKSLFFLVLQLLCVENVLQTIDIATSFQLIFSMPKGRHQLFADTGPDKLENKYADWTSSPIYFLQFPFSVIPLLQRRGWQMDCFRCSRTQAFLPTTFSRVWFGGLGRAKYPRRTGFKSSRLKLSIRFFPFCMSLGRLELSITSAGGKSKYPMD
ncbi:hypothetical protein FXO38_06140 [Capsicum annuum]|nr:hypothetical protein FXO38_06140 [Capsicum annuum]